MSTTVDNRIVEMQFDNREFEVNAKASINTLEKLKDELDMSKAARGFNELDGAAKNVDFNPLMTAVQSVGEKFSAMDVVAITALSRITNAAIDAGKKLVESLSVDQIKEGWSKYEQMTTATQTIMAATAKDIGKLDDNGNLIGYADQDDQMAKVSAQLDKLATFADETSYSLTDMTSNVGKFVSQNIPLEDSVAAMMGIANAAALAGQNSAAASRAMYNLSQSLGMGSVRVQDWMSIENANMATYEFKEMIIETAHELKKLDDSYMTSGKALDGYNTIINATTGELEKVQKWSEGTKVTVENFRSTLSDGWFDNEVLTAVLDKYGRFSSELTELMGNNSDTIARDWLDAIEKFNSKDADFSVEEFAKGIKLLNQETGELEPATVETMSALLEKLGSKEYALGLKAFKAAQEAKTFTEAIDATKDAVSSKFMKIFELIFGNYLEAKELWTDLAEALYDIFAEPLNGVISLFKEWNEQGGRTALWESIYSILGSISKIIDAVKEGFATIFPPKTVDDLMAATDALKAFSEWLEPTDDLLEKIKIGAEGIAKAIHGVSLGFKMVGEIIKTVFSSIGKVIEKYSSPFETLSEDGERFVGAMKRPLELFHTFGEFMEDLYSKFQEGTLLEDISKGIEDFADILIPFLKGVAKWAQEAWASAKEFFGPFITYVNEELEKAKPRFEEATRAIKDFAQNAFGGLGNKAKEAGKNLGIPVDKAKEAVAKIKNTDTTGVTVFVDKVNEKLSPLTSFWEKVKNVFVKIGTFITKAANTVWVYLKPICQSIGNMFMNLVKLFPIIGNALAALFDGIGDLLGKFASGDITLADILNRIFSPETLELVKLAIAGILAWDLARVLKVFKDFGEGLSGLLEVPWLNSVANIIKEVGRSLLMLAAALLVLTAIPRDKLVGVISILTESLTAMILLMQTMKKMDLKSTFSFSKGSGISASGPLGAITEMSKMLVAMASTALIMSGAVIGLSLIGSDKFKQGLFGLAAVLGMSWLFVFGLSKILKKSDDPVVADAADDVGKKTGKEVNFKGLATAMIGVGLAVKIIASTVRSIGNLDPSAFAQGLYGFAVVFGATAAMILVMAKLIETTTKKDISKEQVTTITLTLTLVTSLARVFTRTIKRLGNLSLEQIGKGLLGLTGVLAAMALSLAMMIPSINAMADGAKEANSNIKIKEILAFSASMLILSQAMIGISAAILLLSLMPDVSKAAFAMLGLIAFVGMLGLLSMAMAKVEGSGKNMLAFGAGLVALSIGLNLLIPPLAALFALMAVDAAKTWMTLGAIVAVLAALGVVAALAGPAFIALGAGLLLIGAGAWLAGTGIEKLAKAIVILTGAAAISTLISNIGIGIAGLANTFHECLMSIIKNARELIPQLVGLIFDIFVGSQAEFVGLFVDTLTAILAKIAENMPKIKNSVLTIVKEVAATLWETMPTIFGVIHDAIIHVVEILADILPSIISILWNALMQILGLFEQNMPRIFEVISSVALRILEIIANIAPGIVSILWNAFMQILNLFNENIPQIVTVLMNLLTEIIAQLSEKIPIIVEFVIGALMSILTGVSETLPEIIELIGQTIVDILNGIAEKLPEIIEAGVSIITAFIKGIGDAIPDLIDEAMGLIPKILGGIADGIEKNLPDFMDRGADIMVNLIEGLAEGIERNAQRIRDAVEKLCKAILNAFKTFFGIHSPSKVMEEQGGFLCAGLKEGLTAGWNVVKGGVEWLGGKIKDGLSAVVDGAKGIIETGKNVASGFAEGVKEGANKVKNAVSSVCSGAVNLWNQIWDVHSPSKVTEKIGEYVDLGFVKGLFNKEDEVDKAGESLGSGILSSIKNGLGNLLGENDMLDDLTITPVLDLSEVETGMEDLDDMTSGYENALSAKADFDSYSDSTANGMAVDNSNVVAAINTLRNEVGALSQMVGKLQIVMDTGALVGQLTVPMDEALGRQLVYGNRGM